MAGGCKQLQGFCHCCPQGIQGLAQQAGFDEVEVDDVWELFECDSDKKGLSNDDLKALESQWTEKDSPALESPPVRVFTIKRLAETFYYFKKGMKILSEEDLGRDHSTNMCRQVNILLLSVTRNSTEKKNARQQSLDTLFLSPRKSTTATSTSVNPITSGERKGRWWMTHRLPPLPPCDSTSLYRLKLSLQPSLVSTLYPVI